MRSCTGKKEHGSSLVMGSFKQGLPKAKSLHLKMSFCCSTWGVSNREGRREEKRG